MKLISRVLALRHIIGWPLGVAAMLMWTWLLIKREPVPRELLWNWTDIVIFYAAKCAHATVYMGLTIGFAFLVPRRWWSWLAGGLLFHAIASEVAQHYGALWFNTRRTGKVADVAIDTVGILLGFAVVAWFLRVKSRRNSVPTESSIQDHVRA